MRRRSHARLWPVLLAAASLTCDGRGTTSGTAPSEAVVAAPAPAPTNRAIVEVDVNGVYRLRRSQTCCETLVDPVEVTLRN